MTPQWHGLNMLELAVRTRVDFCLEVTEAVSPCLTLQGVEV